ncbi:hypothetical protein SAMN05216276_109320 [Streptosporangium subroseum]|uniref:Uncharacterized protein n=1 Tax=Streptosporangium subroseum TaxID=106412 RepID=A0A239P793_9ACTN|nr:hypothetical protein [Streptosporangium subroseum]SNT62743.1 hypothetical protein SAMN05216276_109320 [Streptosporangium subroseum]
MGRHAEHGEDASSSRGKRRSKDTPEPGNPDGAIGRRLRPEESAIVETRTGFLGSGWSSAETELSDSVRPEERRRSGGRKMMLLAVAAMIVVLGGTVVGVQVMTSPAGSSTDCPPGGCVLAASNQPVPQAETGEPAGDPAFGEEPDREPGKQGEPEATPTPEATRRSGAVVSAPSPTRAPKATRAPRSAAAEPLSTGARSPADGPELADEPESADRPEESPEPSSSPVSGPLEADETDAPAQPPVDTAPAPAQTSEAPAPNGPATIRVGAGVVREKSREYTVRLVVTAGQRVNGLRLSLPVSGRVSSVSGAAGKQIGDTLVIESGKDLEPGEDLIVNFTARGRAEIPQTCESGQGECSVS